MLVSKSTGPYFEVISRNDVTREPLLQRLVEIRSRLDDKRRRARRHDPRRPSLPLEEFHGGGGRRETEEGHELTRLPAHDDEHVQDGGGKPEPEIDDGGTRHPHHGSLAPAGIPVSAAQDDKERGGNPDQQQAMLGVPQVRPRQAESLRRIAVGHRGRQPAHP